MDRPVHAWFELTYSAYLVLPRLLLENMPLEWQQKFLALLEEIPKTIELGEYTAQYSIQYRVNGKIAQDPFRDYRRGRVKLKQNGR